ncbi:dihydrolipoyl dehydrogenase family protein [Maribacter cobaltidurans]|uniref:Pyridine nucleotide-disulfide oxidoreductase n=1 Tax=Maribacter cobaltidurans TaxID=1178778 RepID=A0A223V2Z0_9FLAO|nr:NAD(P)/FAD-dependent oxidoreductase [Maribacter cobaltidurans]ASV29793.1 pyridine nucleotide-disulfide oxidoreductase [Maribacter cobaltidurans]GGD92511.1 hypothetical protein GCM10011412_33070 [Maribacter cobaltidurans]
MDSKKFDVFVIGSGIAGQTVAKACAEAGKKVAITEKRAFGGTCANRGCDPKKVLLGATEAVEQANNLKQKGIVKAISINWKKLQKFKTEFTGPVPESTKKKLSDLGITLFHESPKFIDEKTLTIGKKKVTAKVIVIATGYEPRKLLFTGNKYLQESGDFLMLKKLPKRITFLGAGYVGMEFAHMAARAGSKVVVMDSGDSILHPFDIDLTKELKDYSEKLGIRFIFNVNPVAIKKKGKKYKFSYTVNESQKSIKTNLVFNTAGRVPALSGLDLEKGNVIFDEQGITTNAFLQSTSNSRVYACGDVSDKNLPLTPLSGRQGYVASENILNGNTKSLDVPVIPSVVFTLPNLASVGYSEEEARSRYKNVIVNYKVVPNWFNAKRINAPLYTYKIIMNKRTGEVVGAHLLGPNAGETINIFAMAMNQKMTGDDLQRTIFTYPSWANDIKSMV